MRNLIFTGFKGFEEDSTLKHSGRNHEGRINKFDDIRVTNFYSQNKVAQNKSKYFQQIRQRWVTMLHLKLPDVYFK